MAHTRRSPYSSEEDEIPDLSPYAPPEEEERSPVMQAALAKRRRRPAQPARPATSPYSAPDWHSTAPEAAGSESFSTTPENRPPRSQEPITRSDVPRAEKTAAPAAPEVKPERSEAWKAVDRKSAELEELNQKLSDPKIGMYSMLAPNAVRQLETRAQHTRAEREELRRQAQYDDDLKGRKPHGRPVRVDEGNGKFGWYQQYANGTQQRIGDAPVDSRIAVAQAKEQAIKNTGRVDETGRFVYVDPDTHQWTEPGPLPGKPAQGNVLDADNPAATSLYSPPVAGGTPRFGKKAESATSPRAVRVTGGYVEDGIFHRTAREKAGKEDSATGAGPKKGTVKTFRNATTGAMDDFTWNGKKWVKNERPGFAASH
jgi:hypothetical protein